MKSFIQLMVINALVSVLLVCSFFTPVKAQYWYSPLCPGNSLFTYGYAYPGGIDPLFFGSLYGGDYYGSLFSPVNYYNPLLTQIMEIYNYLDYCLHFYEIARQTPFFYLYDQNADYIGANLYNYSQNLGVPPQVAIIYFIQENFLSPQG